MIKLRVLVFLLVLLMLIPSSLLSGCGGGGSKAIEGMKWFPSGEGFYSYVNVVALREPEYSSIYRGTSSRVDAIAEYGISLDDVNWFGEFIKTGGHAVMQGHAVVLSGNFNLNELRRKFDDAGNKSSYRGVEIWTGTDRWEACAIMNGLIMAGDSADDLYECIDVVEGLKQPLHDNGDFRDILGRLPTKAVVVYVTTAIPDIYPPELSDLHTIGLGMERIDTNNMGVTYIGKFTQATSASNSFSDFTDWATTDMIYNLEHFQAVQENEFIKVTATFPVSELTTEQISVPKSTSLVTSASNSQN